MKSLWKHNANVNITSVLYRRIGTYLSEDLVSTWMVRGGIMVPLGDESHALQISGSSLKE